MNIITVNFRNLFTIGLVSILGSAIVRFAESRTGLDIDLDGDVSEFSMPFTETDTRKKGARGGKK